MKQFINQLFLMLGGDAPREIPQIKADPDLGLIDTEAIRVSTAQSKIAVANAVSKCAEVVFEKMMDCGIQNISSGGSDSYLFISNNEGYQKIISPHHNTIYKKERGEVYLGSHDLLVLFLERSETILGSIANKLIQQQKENERVLHVSEESLIHLGVIQRQKGWAS